VEASIGGGIMRCPFCASDDTQVKDSRPTEENAAIRRRRICPDCGGRFTTFERVQLRELTVVKRSGRKVPFDREKLLASVKVALRKRPVSEERIERMVSGIVRQIESTGESEVASSAIGSLVMEALKGLDAVAYVRFASVYRDFREAADFQDVLSEIADGDAGAQVVPLPTAGAGKAQP
jgi:transcriptional repressor NrdR